MLKQSPFSLHVLITVGMYYAFKRFMLVLFLCPLKTWRQSLSKQPVPLLQYFIFCSLKKNKMDNKQYFLFNIHYALSLLVEFVSKSLRFDFSSLVVYQQCNLLSYILTSDNLKTMKYMYTISGQQLIFNNSLYRNYLLSLKNSKMWLKN